MEAGQGTLVTHATESILGGKNVVVNDRKFEAATYKRGQIVAIKETVSGAGSVQVGGNTGNATIGSVVVGLQRQVGTYEIRCTAATKAGVYAPNGAYLGELTFGTAFVSAQVELTITAGATPCIAGDGFRVIVTSVSFLYAKYDAAKFDGSQIPAAICMKDIVLNAAGYAPVGFGEFQYSGIKAVMASLTAPISLNDAIVGALDKVGCYLKKS